MCSPRNGLLSAIDCQEVNTLAKLAGAPAHPSAGLRVLRKPGGTVERGEPLLEIHAQSPAHLEFAVEHAADQVDIFEFSE